MVIFHSYVTLPEGIVYEHGSWEICFFISIWCICWYIIDVIDIPLMYDYCNIFVCVLYEYCDIDELGHDWCNIEIYIFIYIRFPSLSLCMMIQRNSMVSCGLDHDPIATWGSECDLMGRSLLVTWVTWWATMNQLPSWTMVMGVPWLKCHQNLRKTVLNFGFKCPAKHEPTWFWHVLVRAKFNMICYHCLFIHVNIYSGLVQLRNPDHLPRKRTAPVLLLTTNPVLLLTKMNMVYHGVIIIMFILSHHVPCFYTCFPWNLHILPAHFRDNQWLPTRKKNTPAISTNLGTYLRRNFGPHGFGMSGGNRLTDGWIICHNVDTRLAPLVMFVGVSTPF